MDVDTAHADPDCTSAWASTADDVGKGLCCSVSCNGWPVFERRQLNADRSLRMLDLVSSGPCLNAARLWVHEVVLGRGVSLRPDDLGRDHLAYAAQPRVLLRRRWKFEMLNWMCHCTDSSRGHSEWYEAGEETSFREGRFSCRKGRLVTDRGRQALGGFDWVLTRQIAAAPTEVRIGKVVLQAYHATAS